MIIPPPPVCDRPVVTVPPPPLIGPESTLAVEEFVTACPAPGRDPKTGRFTTGNPGRPPGRNKHTIWLEALFEAGIEEIGRAIMVGVKRGDMAAARLALDRVSPARRGAKVEIPDFPELKTVADVPLAHAALVKAVADGVISAEEAAPVSVLLNAYVTAVDVVDTAAEVAEIKERLEESGASKRR